MSLQTWQETLISAVGDGTQLSNSTTPTSLLPSTAKYVLPANFFYVGRQLLIEAHGRMSNVVTTPGTFTLDVRLGAVIAFTSSAMQLNAVAKTNLPWYARILLTCRAIGSGTAANLMGGGSFTSECVVGSPLPAAGGAGTLLMPVTAPAVGTGFDSTTTNVVDLFGTFSVATNPTNATLHQYSLWALN